MAGNVAKRPNGRWRARYRDEAGTRRCSPCRRCMGRSVRYFRTDVFAWLAALTDGDTQTER